MRLVIEMEINDSDLDALGFALEVNEREHCYRLRALEALKARTLREVWSIIIKSRTLYAFYNHIQARKGA